MAKLIKKLLNKPILSTLLLLFTLILGIYGDYVWVTFWTGNKAPIIRKFNFLSTTLIGYGLYFPIIVIIITFSLFLLSILKWVKPSIKISF